MNPPTLRLPRFCSRARKGFTLIELLVVISIIAVLAALILAGVGTVRRASGRTKCAANMRQLGAAFLLFTAENGQFPNAGNHPSGFSNWDKDLRPYLGFINPVQSWSADFGVRDPGEADKYRVFRCPDDTTPRAEGGFAQSYSMTGIVCNANGSYAQEGATWPRDEGARPVVIPKPARTALLLENFRAAREDGRRVGQWANSLSDFPDLNATLWAHSDVTNVLFCDGHIESVALSSFAPADRNGSTIKAPAWTKRFSGLE